LAVMVKLLQVRFISQEVVLTPKVGKEGVSGLLVVVVQKLADLVVTFSILQELACQLTLLAIELLYLHTVIFVQRRHLVSLIAVSFVEHTDYWESTNHSFFEFDH